MFIVDADSTRRSRWRPLFFKRSATAMGGQVQALEQLINEV
jgi:hypothetical protein